MTHSINLFPLALAVAAKTMSFDLLGDSALLEAAERKVLTENRNKKIDCILNDTEYNLTVLEETD